MKRQYHSIIQAHFENYSQMVFLMGPRQVGKTTVAKSLQNEGSYYFNWDVIEDRELILMGSKSVAEHIQLNKVRDEVPVIIFDEIHKYKDWKTFIKGFFDTYNKQCNIIVTGSSRLDRYQKSGDSLMGRYFYYRLHPLSLSEVMGRELSKNLIQPPVKPDVEAFDNLLKWGGFPEPFLKCDESFSNRWSRSRHQQFFQEDLRELSRIQELGQIELLANLLSRQSGQLSSYSSFAKKIRVSVDTVRRWIQILESMYYCFSIRPWSKNVSRSLIKEPKYYLWDWSQCSSEGARNENFIASHLLKSVHLWNDTGMGDFELYFLRDKEQREVDFLITKNELPWIMVEAKTTGDEKLSSNLLHFQKQLSAEYVFQVALNDNYVSKNLFELTEPSIVPAKTLLSQLP